MAAYKKQGWGVVITTKKGVKYLAEFFDKEVPIPGHAIFDDKEVAELMLRHCKKHGHSKDTELKKITYSL